MRHKRKNNHLGRKTAHRKAMLSNMATSLIMHKRIFTTVPKAKELRKFVEPLITKSKEDTTHSRRLVFRKLQNKHAVQELFLNVSPKVGDRPGGYTRILKTGYRLGDNASMCFIELVDFNENMLSEGKAKRTRTRRSRRKSSAAAVAPVAAGAETPKAKTEEVNAKEVAEATESVKEPVIVSEETTDASITEQVVEAKEATGVVEVPAEEPADETSTEPSVEEPAQPEDAPASEATAKEEPKKEE
ncbi:MAG TPA: 50S ribosomal protein L17 [Petrimonas sp.]|jgi:large subunit ribosomal protein L17|nr:50S ribosomal protein L17 [Petrimonas sp.]